ncbi:GIP, partial [Symbiodinium pilosum]
MEGKIPADDDGDPFEEEAAAEPPEGDHDEPIAEVEEDEEQRARNDRFKALFQEIGDDIDFQTLHFAVPLRTRTSEEVLKAVRRIYLLLRRDGLALNRLHSDRAREFTSPPIRAWAAARDIFATTSDIAQGSFFASLFVACCYDLCLRVPETSKTTLRPMAAVTPASNAMEDLARALFDEEKFAVEDLLRFWEEASANAFPKGRQCFHGVNPRYIAFGQYTHGMLSGLMSSTYRYPYTVQCLTRCFEEICPYDKFATLTVSEDVGMACHRDVHNESDSYNVVLPLLDCDGGGLWIESEPNQFSLDDEWRPIPNGEWRRGQVHQLRAGRRIVLIGYTPRMGALQKETYDDLLEDLIDRFQERAQHLRELLAEEEVIAAEFAQIGSMAREEVDEANAVIQDMLRDVQRGLDSAVEAADARFLKMAGSPENLLEDVGDIEKYLSELPGDLGTTLTVPLEQVKENLPTWTPAISKEIHNVEEATQALKRIPMHRAKALEREGRLKLVPGKLVFTVKPPAEPSRGVPGAPRWKRKARLVICGNFIDPDASMNLFATGASAESLRVALRLASKACWSAGCTDITGAFLLAIWPADKPTYGVLAPRVLVQAGLARDDEVFLVCRPLYGLREAPALWAQFRSEKLAALKVPFREGFLVLRSVITDSELWRIMFMDAEGELTLCGLLVTYVDDLLYLCLKCVMEALHRAVKEMWPCSALEFAAQGEGVRYLGMELYERDHGFLLGQAGYIETLLKSHGMSPEARAQLPCPKEWLGDEDADAEVENFSETELRQGQRVVGECLWLAFRTRPDLVFVTNYMASLVSKRPCFVYRIGLKVLSYLNATSTLQLRVDGRSSTDSLSSLEHSLPELNQRKVMSLVTLTVVLCAMLAVQSLAVEAKKATEKEPLEVAGAWELSFLLMLSCFAAVVCWEILKVVRSWCARRLFQSERSRNLQRLRDLARLAAEAEIDRRWSGASETASQLVHERVQQVVDRALGGAQAQSRGVQTDISTTVRDVSPPRASREIPPQPSPASSVQSVPSEVSSVQDEVLRQSDRGRLCRDMVMLMTVDNIKQ